jgi:hypothetical protein
VLSLSWTSDQNRLDGSAEGGRRADAPTSTAAMQKNESLTSVFNMLVSLGDHSGPPREPASRRVGGPRQRMIP